MNRFSRVITQSKSQGASQAMLYALGLKPHDMNKAQIGIGSVWYEGNPCNVHLNKIAKNVKIGIKKTCDDKLLSFRFNTIGISDGISMGTKGMLYSLPSREIIADSIESIMKGQCYDGNISIAGCDKNMPGCLMGMIRVNRPSLMIYGGTIKPGIHKGKNVDVVTAFQSYGEYINNKINDEERVNLLQKCCPGPGSCGGMYTANTMASAIEAMGMMLPNSSSNIAESDEKLFEASTDAPLAIKHLLEKNIKPSDIISKKSIENAITAMIALGGSTNGVLHILAIAKTAGISISLEDFNRIGKRVPVIANMKPSGDYVMYDIYKNGGISVFFKYLLEQGLLYGDCLTITGQSLEKNLDYITLGKTHQLSTDIYKIDNPIKNDSHIRIFYGNIAQKGAVGKITGKEGEYFKGPAKVFDTEDDFMEGLENNKIKDGDVIVIRYQGPVGGPGMPEMLRPTSAIAGYGLLGKVAFITDGRFSGGSHGFIIGHISPEAHLAGTIAIIENNDIIEIDAKKNTINLKLGEEEIQNRFLKWRVPRKIYKGYLKKYSKLVSSASDGCITD